MDKSTKKANRSAQLEHLVDCNGIVITTLKTVSKAIAQLFGRQCEVVVHDLRVPESSIIHLENGHVSGRKVGGPLVGGPTNDVALQWLTQYDSGKQVQVYETISKTGSHLKSSTVLFRDEYHKPYAALCINYDISAALTVRQWLTEFIGGEPGELPSDTLASENGEAFESPDVDKILDGMIRSSVERQQQPVTQLSKEQRFAIVHELEEKGAFLIKGAVMRVASTLNVSKFTIYNDIDEIRSNR